MRKLLSELPQAISESIGESGAEVQATHLGNDADGLLRARITIIRGDLTLATDVIRLDRDADRRSLIRGVLKEEKSHLAEISRHGPADEVNEGSSGAATVELAEESGRSEPAGAPCLPKEAPIVPLNAFEIERALLQVAKSLRALGTPPTGRPRGPDSRSVQAPGTEIGDRGDKEPADRPELIIRSDLAEFTDQAQSVLMAFEGHGIYQRGRMLVRVGRETAPKVSGLTRPVGAPVIEALSLPALRDLLARSAKWRAIKEEQVVSALPPKWVAETLLARGDWPFSRLAGVIETPTLRPDGTILETPGYDQATGFLYDPSTGFPAIPTEPSPDDMVAAIKALWEPFSEFPFVAESDWSGTLAAILTLVGRSAIDGPTPLFAIRATAPGTGKGFLAKVASLIGTGREPTLFAVSREDEEVRKRLLTIGLEGTRCVLLDNVEGTLGSPVLAAALTASEFTDRILGSNRLVTVPMDAVWLTTGNNIAFRGDLGRRVLPIDLNSKVEFPEDREFRRKNLIQWVRQERPRLVVAALTLLRAFYVAGRPDHGFSHLGSFEGWDSVARAAVVHLGLEDPCAGRQRVRTESDTDLEALGALLQSWWDVFGNEPQTLARVIEQAFEAGGNEVLASALAALDPKSDGRRPNSRSVGDRFRRWKGRITGGLVLETDEKKDHGVALWRVAQAGM